MAKYSHDRIVPFKDSELSKKQQVTAMFDGIAFRYDFLNRFLSGGIDLYWRRRAIKKLFDLHPTGVLDVATGTADMAIMMSRLLHPRKITGIDISNGMLEIGRQKIHRLNLEDRIELRVADSEDIPFPDGSFDAITVAFGVRNFENLERGLQEMWRVLRPGGRLVILEFSRPRIVGVRQFYDLYLRIVCPGLAKLMSSNRDAYRYLNNSVQAFPEGKDFSTILTRCGYSRPTQTRLSLGICSLYTGEKPPDRN